MDQVADDQSIPLGQKVIYGQPINGAFGGGAAGVVPGVTVQGSSVAGTTRSMG